MFSCSCVVYNGAHLVCGGVSKTGEEGEETRACWSRGLLPENDGVQLSGRGDLALVAHQALGRGVDGVEDGEFGDTSRSCSGQVSRETRSWHLQDSYQLRGYEP